MARCTLSFHFNLAKRNVNAFQATKFTWNSSSNVKNNDNKLITNKRLTTVGRLYSSASSSPSDGKSTNKKRVVFLGTPEVAASTLQRLYEDSQQDGSIYDIVSVITQPPKRRKRKGKLEPSPVGKVAEEIGIPVLCPEKVRYEKEVVENEKKSIISFIQTFDRHLVYYYLCILSSHLPPPYKKKLIPIYLPVSIFLLGKRSRLS